MINIIPAFIEERKPVKCKCARQNFFLPMHCNQSSLCKKLGFVPLIHKLVLAVISDTLKKGLCVEDQSAE